MNEHTLQNALILIVLGLLAGAMFVKAIDNNHKSDNKARYEMCMQHWSSPPPPACDPYPFKEK